MEQEIPVRVITVPKTQAKPRIIAIEPSAMLCTAGTQARDVSACEIELPCGYT
jgi:hypothetical protein